MRCLTAQLARSTNTATRSASPPSGATFYRGNAIPDLRGAYLFGDLTGPVWMMGTDGVVQSDLQIRALVSFAEAPDGELYAVSLAGGIYKLVAD